MSKDFTCKDCKWAGKFFWLGLKGTRERTTEKSYWYVCCDYMLRTGEKRGVYPANNCYKKEGTPYRKKERTERQNVQKRRDS